MSKWKKGRLGEIADVSAGQGAPQGKENYCKEGIPFLKAANLEFLVEGGSLTEIQKVGPSVAKDYKLKLYRKGTVVFAKSGMSCMKGFVYSLVNDCYVVNHLACITPDVLVNDKFLKYYLMFRKPNLLVKDMAYPSITLSDIREIQIPLPPLDTQRKIADTLDTVSGILAMRKKQLAELDNLIKSIFYDMFGDPIVNEKGWPKEPIGEFSTVRIGPFGSVLHKGDYIKDGRSLINPSHIIDGRIIPDPEMTVSDAKFDQLNSYQMREGDIVVGRRGEIGRCAVVEENGYLCGTGSMFVRIKQEYLPEILQHVISSPSVRSQLEHRSVGVTMKNLNASTISSLEVPIIPLSLQQKFLELKHKIDARKAQIIDTIAQTQYLFDSLMSRYFD